MVSYHQLKEGIIKFLNKELINKMDQWGKLGANSMVYILEKKSDAIFENLKNNQLLLTTEIIDKDGMIDAELILDAIKNGMEDKVKLDTGILGTITFSKEDINTLRGYISETN